MRGLKAKEFGVKNVNKREINGLRGWSEGELRKGKILIRGTRREVEFGGICGITGVFEGRTSDTEGTERGTQRGTEVVTREDGEHAEL